MPGIAPLPRELIHRAVSTLQRAFQDDPMFRWMFPDADERTRALGAMIGVPLAYGLRYGRVRHTEEGRAVAIWVPPGRPVSVLGMIRSGMLALPFRLGFRAFGRFAVANSTMERIHTRRVPEPHWYLQIVGVDPALHGRGLGSALVRDGLEQADRDGVSCYLETSHDRNLRFYERHGFRILESAPLGAGAPPGWAMQRDASVRSPTRR